MTATPPDLQSIFGRAVEIESAAGRTAYLDEACGPDADLRAEVEGLLAALGKAGGFMRRPAPAEFTAGYEPLTEGPGTVIGPYKLLQQIGEGGMGAVYMAEQQAPVRRKVALKVIKPGMDSRQVIARFEAERQALAMMEHQNIAKVLDAGTTESERPYFVMELVHGVPLTKYCDDRKLTPRQRLELFIPVCHAVQHAHQKGIIHRDLKPSNILVTMYDDQPVPKVIDFGVAKAVEQRLTEKTLFTQFGTLVGTFEYMSPEQAEMNAFGVDTRSDVYSLGVLLYELLTGSTPLEQPRLRAAAYGEIVRLIKEEEPPRPSTRLSSSGAALAGISQQRGSDPGQLTKLVRGELDWIVMRCLEKNRTRRYETANGLARDVERYLNDEAVEACPPTAGYKLRKFARTHRRLLATATAFAALLVLGVAASARQAVRATQAEAVALENEQKANDNAAQAEKERDQVQVLNEQLRATQEQLRRTLYAAHMNLAKHAWDADGIERAQELLEHHCPKPGETDLRGFEWYYLDRLSHAEMLTLKGHRAGVVWAAYSPDGKRLASAAHDKTVKVWDVQTGKELLTFTGHSGLVNCVTFSPDSKRLASCSTGPRGGKAGEVKVWDAQTGKELLKLEGHTDWWISSVAFSPDGKQLASAAHDKTVRVWDAQTGQELLALQGNKGEVQSVTFSPDGKRLAASGRGAWDDTKKAYVTGGEVKVWDAQTGRELLALQGHTNAVSSVAFSPDGKQLASGSEGLGGWEEGPGEVKVWDAQSGRELLALKGLSGTVTSVAFSPDGKRLASGVAGSVASGGPGHVKVWDTQTGQQLFTLKDKYGVMSVAFSPDGKCLASSGLRVKVWDVPTENPLVIKVAAKSVDSVAISPDGKRLATARTISEQGKESVGEVKVWDAQTGKELLSLKGGGTHVTFSPDGKRLASTAVLLGQSKPGAGGRALVGTEVKVWDAQTGQELLSLKGGGASVAFSPDGKRLASTSTVSEPMGFGFSGSGQVKVWDAQTGQELLSLKGGGASVAFSPDGKRLAASTSTVFQPGKKADVKVWDAQTGEELLSIKDVEGSMAFSPDGKRLAATSPDDSVKVWDAQTGQELLTFKGHTSDVFGVTFSPDGKRLASASRDKTVRVWDAQTGQELLALQGSGRFVAFSPDGHRLASGAADGTVKIWDATPLPEK